MKNIAIIGGGPAGFTAAIALAENSCGKFKIDIIDKSEPLKKLLLTGGGRCNITNATYDFKELASNYPRGEKFLYSVFNKFGVKETIDWLNAHGVKLYTQDDGRVFPRSDKAETVRDFLINRAKELGITIKSNKKVLDIIHTNNKFIVYFPDKKLEYDKVIISTGGNYRNIEASGYKLAEKLGHSITKLKPSLVGLILEEKQVSDLEGISVKKAEITAFFNQKQAAKASGDFIFTNKGISGPCVFKISSLCAFIEHEKNSPIVVKINFLPDKNKEELEKELVEEFKQNPKKSVSNILKKYGPRALITKLLEINSIDPDRKTSEVNKNQRKSIINFLTNSEFKVSSYSAEGEMVTAGGVKLNKINPKTMESKIVKNLYFCGEILDIDGFTGGFNLQAAWSTGYIAGFSMSQDF